MQSLQKELLENIKQAYPNSQSLDELFAISQMLGHKDSLCERKLRLLVQSKLVEVLKDDKKQNYAYKWIKPTINDYDIREFTNTKIQDKLFEVRIPLD